MEMLLRCFCLSTEANEAEPVVVVGTRQLWLLVSAVLEIGNECIESRRRGEEAKPTTWCSDRNAPRCVHITAAVLFYHFLF